MTNYVHSNEPLAHTFWDQNGMKLAIDLAKQSITGPFGCVIIDHNSGIAKAYASGTGILTNPIRHSEIVAITKAIEESGYPKEFLKNTTLISTHEPCMMCCGAINHAKISRVVWGSFRSDLPKLFKSKIAAEILLSMTTHPPILHPGMLREECIALFDGVEKWD